MTGAPYVSALGLHIEHADADGALVRVPFQESNSNPGGALHGGVVASIVDVAAAAAAKAGAPARDGLEYGAIDLTIDYLAAAITEDVVGAARVLRRGKELAYVAVDVRTEAGKAIATGLVTWRAGEPGNAERQLHRDVAPPAPPDVQLPSFVRFFTAAPFMARLGLAARMARDGVAEVALPWHGGNADADGRLHEGALAALVDTTAAMASWSLVPLDPRNKASTVGLHLSPYAPACDEEVVAVARTLRRNNEIFQNVVEVRGVTSGRRIAAGSVTYRIVVPA